METRAKDAVTGAEKGVKLERYDFIPSYGLEQLAKVYGFGASKYEDHNWRKGYRYSWSLAALFRHLMAWKSGERFDAESGCEHLAHVMWHCLTLMEFEKLGLGKDDRFCATDVSLQWLAGIIDGEGCITIATRKRKTENRSDSHFLSVSVTMTTDEPLQGLKAYFGGWIGKPRKRGNNKPIKTWAISGPNAAKALIELLPYLVVKKSQALIGIEFQERLNTRQTRKLLPKELSIRNGLQSAIKAMHKESSELCIPKTGSTQHPVRGSANGADMSPQDLPHIG